MITVYTIAYNEEFMLPHFIKHYRTMFPMCRIVVYDNESNDRTVEIALAKGCEVITYTTGGKLDDLKYLEIKNNCWKTAATPWVLIADVDEFCDVKLSDLKRESKAGATIFEFEGYNMVNPSDDMDIDNIMTGVRAPSYDKSYLFNKDAIKEINYGAGAHKAIPKGLVIPSNKTYRCRHYKYINPDYMIKRHAVFASRLSDVNLQKGYGWHYLYSEKQIREEFNNARLSAQIVY